MPPIIGWLASYLHVAFHYIMVNTFITILNAPKQQCPLTTMTICSHTLQTSTPACRQLKGCSSIIEMSKHALGTTWGKYSENSIGMWKGHIHPITSISLLMANRCIGWWVRHRWAYEAQRCRVAWYLGKRHCMWKTIAITHAKIL